MKSKLSNHHGRWRAIALAGCAAAAVSGLAAQSAVEEDGRPSDKVEYALILPEEKTPELVKVEDRNPFQAGEDSKLQEVTNSEQNLVRERMLALPVVGVSPGPKGIRVLLGDIRLEEGLEVPPIIPNQTVRLRVSTITEHGVELLWVDRKQTGLPPVPLHIPIDTSPRIKMILKGQPTGLPSNGPGSSSGPPAMDVWQPRGPAVEPEGVRKAPIVENGGADAAPASGNGTAQNGSQGSPASALLNLFFNKDSKAPASR